MRTVDFLRLVTPVSGTKALAVPRGTNKVTNRPYFLHFTHVDHTTMAARAQALEDTAVYFALGGFKEGSLDDYEGRTQANVEYLKSFWLDIDVGADAKKYPTQKAAASEVYKFCEVYNLPSPLIVKSGGGLHIYWPLDKDCSRDEWKIVAVRLKQATRDFGLKVDHSRTTDEASILRPVGTFNTKTSPPREVKATNWGGRLISLDSFAANLPTASVIPIRNVSDDPVLQQMLGESTPKSAKQVMSKCAQMKWALENMQYGSEGVNKAGESGESVSEPLWLAGISILARCKNPEKNVDLFSRSYPSYNQEEALDKLNRFKDSPYRCETFDTLNPGVCSGCKYKGKIKSPIVLGMEYESLPAPEITIGSQVLSDSDFSLEKKELTITSINPPEPYKRTAKGLVKRRKIPATDEDGSVIKGKFIDEDWRFSDYDIFPLFQTRERDDGTEQSSYSSTWRVAPIAHPELTEDVTVRGIDLASDDKLKSCLYERAAYAANEVEHKEICSYMRSYMKLLGEQQTHPQPTKFGWQEHVDLSKPINEQPISFVLGKSCYRRKLINGEWVVDAVPISPSSSIIEYANYMEPTGSLEGWKNAAAWYTDKHTPRQIATLLITTAAPFMRFSKDSGVVVMARGSAGTGKSLLLSLVSSIWGNPRGYTKGGTNSIAGAETFAAMLQNLPVVMDDKITNDSDVAADEIMMLANGRGKTRGTVSGGHVVAAQTKTWLTNSLLSSNKSWVELLNARKANTEGESARICEIEIPRLPRDAFPVQGPKGEELYKSYVNGNYGIVGRVLMQMFLKDPKFYVDKFIDYETMVIEGALTSEDSRIRGLEPSTYRLQSAGIAGGLLVLYMLRKAKIVDWSPKTFLECGYEIIAEACKVTRDNTPTKNDLVGQFVSEHHGSFVVATAGTTHIGGTTSEEMSFGKMPNLRVVGRMDHVTQRLYIDRSLFRTWLAARGFVESSVFKGLSDEGWSIGNTRMTLTKGFATGINVQSRVIELSGPPLQDISNRDII